MPFNTLAYNYRGGFRGSNPPNESTESSYIRMLWIVMITEYTLDQCCQTFLTQETGLQKKFFLRPWATPVNSKAMTIGTFFAIISCIMC